MTTKTIIAIVAGLVVVLLVAWKLLRGGKGAARRELFRRTINDWRKSIETTPLREFAFSDSLAFHVNVKHVPELEGEIVDVAPHISSRRHRKMEAAFAAYKAIVPHSGDEKKNGPVKVQMLSLLDKIRNCAR
jgi:hypothetical protein